MKGGERMNEEVIRMIAESPEALTAFESWMNLQWAEFFAGTVLLTAVVVGAFGLIYWEMKNA